MARSMLGGDAGRKLCCPRTMFPGSRNVPNVPDVPNVPHVPNNVPNENRDLGFFQQLAKRLCPSELYRDSVPGGTVGLKSYCTVVETHRVGTKQVFNIGIQHWHSTLTFNDDIQH